LLLSIESRDLGCDIRVKAVIGEPFAIAVDGNAMRRSGQPHAVGCLSVNDFRRNFVSNEDGALRWLASGDRDGARSEEGRVGDGWVSTGGHGGSRNQKKK